MQEPSVLDFVKSRTRYWLHKLLNPSAVMEVESTGSEFWQEERVSPVIAQADASQTVQLSLDHFVKQPGCQPHRSYAPELYHFAKLR